MNTQFYRIGFALTFAIGLVVSCGGCANPSTLAEPWINYKNGGKDPNEAYAMTTAHFERWANQELRGEKPAAFPTWKALWHDEYQRLRTYSESPEQAQQLRESAHRVLQRAGLPTYDP